MLLHLYIKVFKYSNIQMFGYEKNYHYVTDACPMRRDFASTGNR